MSAERLIQMARAEEANEGTCGVWSTGEQCAVGLLMNRAEVLPGGYTFLDAVARIVGDPIFDDVLAATVQGWRE